MKDYTNIITVAIGVTILSILALVYIFHEPSSPSETEVNKEESLFIGWFNEYDSIISTDINNPLGNNINITNTTTLKARFKKVIISVGTPITPDGGIVLGSGTFDVGAMVSIKAIPRENKKFIGWFENDTLISNDTVYSFTAEKDRSIDGYFK